MSRKLAKQNAIVLKNALSSAKRIERAARKNAEKPLTRTTTVGNRTFVDTLRGGRLTERFVPRGQNGPFVADKYVLGSKQSRKAAKLFMKGGTDKKFQLAKGKRTYDHYGVAASGAETLFHGKEKAAINTRALRDANRLGRLPNGTRRGSTAS